MSFVRSEIDALTAYHVAPAQGLIKLDAMENPYSLPPTLQKELAQILAQATINRYPDPTANRLTTKLRECFSIAEECEIVLGNGSDEIIQMLAMLVAKPHAKLLTVEPSFTMYQIIATVCQVEYIGVNLREDFNLDVAALLAAIKTHQPALIFLAYPNNPTGNAFHRHDIEQIINAAPGLVVIDEAYFAFAEDTFLADIPQYPNLLVMRTLSKLGFAGLRLGFIVGHARWIQALNKIRMPYNINILSQLAGEFALHHHDVLRGQTQRITQARTDYFACLANFPAFQAYPSQANFILLRVPDANHLFAYFKAAGILVKNLHGTHPQLTNCLRITVGTLDENKQVIDTLQRYKQQHA